MTPRELALEYLDGKTNVSLVKIDSVTVGNETVKRLYFSDDHKIEVILRTT